MNELPFHQQTESYMKLMDLDNMYSNFTILCYECNENVCSPMLSLLDNHTLLVATVIF
jgi:hypothetical protein